MVRNPVMFVIELGARLRDTALPQGPRRRSPTRRTSSRASSQPGSGSPCSSRTSPRRWQRAVARRRPRHCRSTRAETTARRRRSDGSIEELPSSRLAVGDQVVVTAGEVIPSDGDVVEGIATVDESAITGESAPVIRESGGDRSAVTGGTRVLSDEIVVRVTTRPGESFLDRMIALVEGATRQKTPNEIALDILLAGLTIILLLAVVTPAAVRDLLGRRAAGDRARGAPDLPDPDDDRSASLGDRDRRHGSARAAQRARAQRSSRRGGGRLLDAAPRQDRHDHARQPAGGRLHPRTRRFGRGARRRRTALEPRRRDPGGPLDRRPREGALRASRPRAARRLARALHGPDADERRRDRRSQHPQGRGRRHSTMGRGVGRIDLPRARGFGRLRSPPRAVHRSSWPRAAGPSGSSTSRTSSRRGSASASRSCARWGSAR